jgi:hypothetical protein
MLQLLLLHLYNLCFKLFPPLHISFIKIGFTSCRSRLNTSFRLRLIKLRLLRLSVFWWDWLFWLVYGLSSGWEFQLAQFFESLFIVLLHWVLSCLWLQWFLVLFESLLWFILNSFIKQPKPLLLLSKLLISLLNHLSHMCSLSILILYHLSHLCPLSVLLQIFLTKIQLCLNRIACLDYFFLWFFCLCINIITAIIRTWLCIWNQTQLIEELSLANTWMGQLRGTSLAFI